MNNIERISVEKEGFFGIWHKAENERDASKALIVLGGSEGNENIPMNVGKMFAERGISALGVLYFNAPGLPESLVQVPVESIESAVKWLRGRGYEKIYIYGISKGGELALLSASLIPEIGGVIALSPIQCVWTGLAGNKGLLNRKTTSGSEFTWRGEDLPCMQSKINYFPGIWHLITQWQIDLRYIYEKPLENFREETAIKVENIKGNILFIYAEEDLMWPSKNAVKYMLARLEKLQWPFKAEELCYEKASHIVVPLSPKALKMFKVERKYPEECLQSRMDAFEKSLKWIEKQ